MKFKSKRRSPSKTYRAAKMCRFCIEKTLDGSDYKNLKVLRTLVTEKGKIIPRRISGTCAKHQRQVTTAINRARNIALLPFSA